MYTLKIPRHILNEMVAHARELDPYECCGLLAGKDVTISHLYRIKNIVALEGAEITGFDTDKVEHLQRLSPEQRAEIAFAMDSQDLSLAQKDMRSKEVNLQVVYHSHPHSPARPSVTDIKIATDYEENWEKINLTVPAFLIISLEDKSKPDVQAYWIKAGRAIPADYQII